MTTTTLPKHQHQQQQSGKNSRRTSTTTTLFTIGCCCVCFLLGRASKMADIRHLHLPENEAQENCHTTTTPPHHGAPNDLLVVVSETQQQPHIPPERQRYMRTTTTVDIDGLQLCHTTGSRGFEPIFDSLMGTILREPGFIPDHGAMLDVGAQFAEQSCHFASIHPHRQMYTIDPSASNQAFANTTYSHLIPTMILKQGAVGSQAGFLKSNGHFFNMRNGLDVPVFTLDSIFFDQGVKLAFAHIDVEGMELEALKGGVKTIQQNSPVFTTEVRVHKNPQYTRDLLDFIDDLGYDSYVVNEVCGTPFMDYRNVLNVPRALSTRLVHSDVFTLALATETIFRVDRDSIFQLVYPCCAAGAACCPGGEVHKPRSGCCSEKAIDKYLKDNPTSFPIPVAKVLWWHAKSLTDIRSKELAERANATSRRNAQQAAS